MSEHEQFIERKSSFPSSYVRWFAVERLGTVEIRRRQCKTLGEAQTVCSLWAEIRELEERQ